MSDQTPAFKRYADQYFVTKVDVDRRMKALSSATGDVLGKQVQKLSDRIAELEREVGRLKGHAPDREEWPLRSIEGGKRG